MLWYFQQLLVIFFVFIKYYRFDIFMNLKDFIQGSIEVFVMESVRGILKICPVHVYHYLINVRWDLGVQDTLENP